MSTQPLTAFHIEGLYCQPDEGVKDALEKDFEYTIGEGSYYDFESNEDAVYDMLSMIAANNVAVFMELGFTPEKAVRFIQEHQLEHILVLRFNEVAEAKRLNITPVSFMEMSWLTPESVPLSETLDAYRKLAPYPTCKKYLLNLIISNTITMKDVEAVGLPLLEASPMQSSLTTCLMKLGTTPDITVDDIRQVILDGGAYDVDPGHKNHTYMVTGARFSLLGLMGREALTYQHPRLLEQFIYVLPTSHLKYVDDLLSNCDGAEKIGLVSKITGSLSKSIIRFSTEGADVEVVLQGIREGWSDNQIIAISKGTPTAVSEGWL